MFVPIPGFEVAPKAPVVLPNPPPPVPPPKREEPEPVGVPEPKAVVAGLLPPNSDVPPPNVVEAVVGFDPKPPLPKPDGPAVEVDEPNKPPPLVVVVDPKAGLF